MEILIGKGENCNYRINEDVVSRNHCKIILQQNNLYIIDLNSTNGTFVNHQKIQAQTMVNIATESEIHLSGMVLLDWSIIRGLLPAINSIGRTKYVSPEEIERRMKQRSGEPYHSVPQENIAHNPSGQVINIAPQQQTDNRRSDLLYAAHAGKSYVGAAFLTWIFYYIGFYIIGLIMNIVYLNQASTTSKVTGTSPSGYGCLQFLIFVHVILPILLILMLIAGVIHIGSFLPDFLHF